MFDTAGWAGEADRLVDRMAGRFARVETRRRVRKFVFGPLADLPRRFSADADEFVTCAGSSPA